MFDRKMLIDCPMAVIKENIIFPPIREMPITINSALSPIAINMMPFDLFHPKESLPVYVHGYIDMIKECRKFIKSFVLMERGSLEDPNNIKHRIAYLTVDERPISEVGRSHRRGGLHVESPGALRKEEVIDKSRYMPELEFYHPWGMGRSSGEFLVGGVFLASNLANTTAVWNCRVHDTFGDMIGKHGSLERCRDILGKPSKILNAGELVWMTDRTPHESLPVQDLTKRRQFFRLVVGEIGFWFVDHNTVNPTGFKLPSDVKIIRGNKFSLTQDIPIVWECGSQNDLVSARSSAELRSILYQHSLGFLADHLSRLSIVDKASFIGKFPIVMNHARKLLKDEPHSTEFFVCNKLYVVETILRNS
jgi:hypothetical protein